MSKEARNVSDGNIVQNNGSDIAAQAVAAYHDLCAFIENQNWDGDHHMHDQFRCVFEDEELLRRLDPNFSQTLCLMEKYPALTNERYYELYPSRKLINLKGTREPVLERIRNHHRKGEWQEALRKTQLLAKGIARTLAYDIVQFSKSY